MNIIHNCEVFDPQELIKQSNSGDNPIKLTIEDYNTFLSAGSQLHTFTGTACGERRIEKALDNAVSPNDSETVLNRSVALMVLISYNQHLTSSLTLIELMQLTDFIGRMPSDCDIVWGTRQDNDLNDSIKVTLLAMLP